MFTRENPSPQYTELLTWAIAYHATAKTWTGRRVIHSFTVIQRLCELHRAKTILDYGCGKGQQYTLTDFEIPGLGVIPDIKTGWGVDRIEGFDPACPPFQTMPEGRFDGVIATDALEYIPEQDMQWVLREMFSRADKFVFARTGVRLSQKKRPKGYERDDREIAWWVEQFALAGAAFPDIEWCVEVRMNIEERPDGETAWRPAWRGQGSAYREDPQINSMAGVVWPTPEPPVETIELVHPDIAVIDVMQANNEPDA